MRVGIGVILSVLSFSVLAAVIPNYDDHGILLVRRAVNPDNRVVLWKRADEKQTGHVSSSSSAGASAESDINSELDDLDQLRDYTRRLYKFLIKNWNTPMKKAIRWSDKKSIKAAIKKLTRVTRGLVKDKFISNVHSFLSSILEGARAFVGLYDNSAKRPFLLPIPKGNNQRAFLKEMVRIQKAAKKIAKEHLENVLHIISNIKKSPQDVMEELEKIMDSVSTLYKSSADLSDTDERILISMMKSKNNEKYIEVTKTRISEMNRYEGITFRATYIVILPISTGRITFKEKTPSRFGAFKSQAKSRLGFKKKLPTDETSDQEPSNPEPSDQGPPNQDTSDKDTSDKDTSDQESSDEEVPDQARARPIPAPRKSKLVGLETRV
ncbi:hypothetical protein BSLG_003775 [Batrachochytrium salamandrivorans]|nr:hypothetical protein BSLG_003775 [Batrachochytrium salamandrivorans]